MDVVSMIPRNLVVAYIEDHPKAVMLLRMARKRAEEISGKWVAVFVETPSQLEQADAASSERILQLITLAERMGGEAKHFEAKTAEEGLTQFLEKEAPRIALVIIGSVKSEGWRNYMPVTSWARLVKRAGKYARVEIVRLNQQHYRRSFLEIVNSVTIHPMRFLSALLAVAVAYLAAVGLELLLPPASFQFNDMNVMLLFMIACAFAAGRYGLLPGLVASAASIVLMGNSLIVPYEAKAHISQVTSVINMMLFLFAALLISLFASRNRNYAQNAAKREKVTEALFSLYRMMSETFSREQALIKLQEKLERMLEVDVAFFLPSEANAKSVEPACPKNLALEEADRKALDSCWDNLHTTGVAAPYNPGTKWRFEPMIAASGEIGVFGIRLRDKTRLDAWFGRMLPAVADQTAVVLEHLKLEQAMGETRVSEEREKLRSMLLSSISHDFKTPIAGIVGALSVHQSMGSRLTEAKRDELIEAAIEEAQRLDSFITNILDMTRLESGNIRFKQDWYDIDGILEGVTKRMQHRLRNHILEVRPNPPDVEVYMDAMMVGQVLQNLLDNACKYTPAGTRIEISCSVDKTQGFLCQVRDYGNGLSPEKMGHIFDKYTRLHKKDLQVAGTGLGLAIAKAVMEAQGGWVRVANHPEGGAVFTLCLPKWRKVKVEKMQGAGG